MGKKHIIFIFAILVCVVHILNTPPAVQTLSRYGSRGQEVINIQTRLKQWGYYKGIVDGVYGNQTVAAVKYFQRMHGLTADGIAGPLTLKKIGLATGSSSSGATNSDINLLARVINGEARGEPYTGQVAIGAVILNRVKHPSFPKSIAGVIYQPGAFDVVANGQINAPLVESCVKAARDAMNGWDPSGGAIYYYNPATATNQWIRSRPVVATIGRHVFCK